MPPPSAAAVAAVGGFGGFAGVLDEGDLSWAKDAEPVLDTHLGEGSSAFRCERGRLGHVVGCAVGHEWESCRRGATAWG